MNYYKGWILSFNQTRPPGSRWRAKKDGQQINATSAVSLRKKIDGHIERPFQNVLEDALPAS